MSTATRTVTIPEALEEWRPACDMFFLFIKNKRGKWRTPKCGNAATLAVIIHENCGSTVSCVDCFVKFSSTACTQKSRLRGDHECSHCGFASPYLSRIIKAVPL